MRPPVSGADQAEQLAAAFEAVHEPLSCGHDLITEIREERSGELVCASCSTPIIRRRVESTR